MISLLGRLPTIVLQVVEDFTHRTRPDEGFLRVRRQRLRAHLPDGSISQEFVYDSVERTALDAVVVAAHFVDSEGRVNIFLRSALRPPAVQRRRDMCPIPEPEHLGHLWELPAGLVEPREQTEQGLRACASRELGEELGFHIEPGLMQPLGHSTFPSPAVIGERHYYFHCRVDPALQVTPEGDGSPLERLSVIVTLRLSDALDLLRRGEIEDAKTEIALRRLAEAEMGT